MYKCIFFFVAILLITSCKKKPTTVITGIVLPETFLPNTAGSSWEYAISGILSGTKTVAPTGRDTTFADYPTYKFNIMDAGSNGYDYQCRQGSNYYITVPYSTTSKPYHVIKGDAAINDKWIGAINGTDTYYVQLLEKNISYTLDTTTFTNTLHLKQTRVDNSGNTTMDLDTYVAYNVGIVYTAGTVSGFNYKSKLVKAFIK